MTRLAAAFMILLAAAASAGQTPPGAIRDPALEARLEAAYAAKGPDYAPRTRYLDDGRARYVNRLIAQASPYLLQHAHNPVDWRAWGDAAFAEARARDVPVFVSFGYATCHWCHVMEEESFDDEEVALLLNRDFVAIKIDREERPDLDRLYMMATELQQGSGGWPNSVWMTPEGRPFHTATYLPKAEFMQVLGVVADVWNDPADRVRLKLASAALIDALRELTQARARAGRPLDDAVYADAAATILGWFNDFEGGFSAQAQFPQAPILLFLLDHWRRTGDADALHAVTTTLDAIVAGGIHDQVGGGFHRYTVDPNWRTPHFEKMLYTQALLSLALVEAWEATHAPRYRRAAERAFEYVLRDMRGPGGGFYAAEDADSLNPEGEMEEGAYYVWRPAQAAASGLTADEISRLGIDQPPTVEGGAVVHLVPEDAAGDPALDAALSRLLAARRQRPPPLQDHKVIAGWNGLMIRALAEGGTAFGAPRYVEAAETAAEFVWTRLWSETDGLARFHAPDGAEGVGGLDDYAWLGLGALALADAGAGTRSGAVWKDRAGRLAAAMWPRFADENGRLKLAQQDGPLGPIYGAGGGPTPAAEAAAMAFLARLALRGGGPEAEARAGLLRAALSGFIAGDGANWPMALAASRIAEGGESGYRQAVAEGRVTLGFDGVAVSMSVAPGWHVTAHAPGPDWLVPAEISGARAEWPAGRVARFGFSTDAFAVYEGALDLPVTPEGEIVSVTVQACSDAVCLQPATATFRAPLR